MQNSPILILGGLGKTGWRVAQRLESMGVPVRVASRSSAPRFDWTDRSLWAGALKGASIVYVTYQPDLAVPGSADDIAELARTALDVGVKKIVLLSGRGEDGAVLAEEALQISGIQWTILRATWFAQNFSEGHFLHGILAGELALPARDVREPFVDADDIADVAVAALTDDRHTGQVYELTGAQSLTFAEAVAEIAKATGRPIHYVPVSPEEFADALRRAGEPEDVIALLHELFTQVLDGRNSRVMNGVERAIGRPARGFADYVRDIARTGLWTPNA
jgi:uncharacterized protein YbjT (DUF2867 family)